VNTILLALTALAVEVAPASVPSAKQSRRIYPRLRAVFDVRYSAVDVMNHADTFAKSNPTMTIARIVAFAALTAISMLPTRLGAQSLVDQYVKAQRPSMAIEPLDTNLFGEQVSMLDGSISFINTDVSVPTNSGMPMTIGRVLSIQDQTPDSRNIGTYRDNGPFGMMWDIAVPNLKATVDARLGWVGKDRSVNRCSQGGAAPWVQGVPPFWKVVYESEHYYSGVLASIPSYGEEYLLKPAAGSPVPNDGMSYVKTSKSGWRVRCIQQLKRGSGEGFLVVLPDGSHYQFDWLVSRATAALMDATCVFRNNYSVLASPQAAAEVPYTVCSESVSVPRDENILFATEATDRFGNKITYTYDPVNPLRLQKVESSDGARIDLTYYSTGQIETIKSGGRTWRYLYDSFRRLVEVQLPDQSKWTYEYGSDYKLMLNTNPVLTWDHCVLHIGTRTTSVAPGPHDTSWIKIGHPSGAKGEFKLRRIMHGTKETETKNCTVVPWCSWGGCTSFERIKGPPSAYQIASLYQKTISGPALTTQTWDYHYQPSWTAPYTSETVVTHSSGRVEKYTFGNDKTSNYGHLLKKVIGTSTQTLSTENYSYLNSSVGQNFGDVGWEYSTAIYSWSGAVQAQHRPLIRKETLQQGRKFIWGVNTGCLQAGAYCFDKFVRPLSITKRSE
jgi:YD repeat-containing protein